MENKDQGGKWLTPVTWKIAVNGVCVCVCVQRYSEISVSACNFNNGIFVCHLVVTVVCVHWVAIIFQHLPVRTHRNSSCFSCINDT